MGGVLWGWGAHGGQQFLEVTCCAAQKDVAAQGLASVTQGPVRL